MSTRVEACFTAVCPYCPHHPAVLQEQQPRRTTTIQPRQQQRTLVSSNSKSDPVNGARYRADSTAAAPTIAYAGDPAIVSSELRSPLGPPRPSLEVTGSRKTLAAAKDGPAADRKAVKQPCQKPRWPWGGALSGGWEGDLCTRSVVYRFAMG